MLEQYEIPVAYSMVELAQQSARIAHQPFQEFMCYWTAFNNIYTTIAERNGHFARLRIQRDGTIRVRENGSVRIPEVEITLRERDEIDLAFTRFSEALKTSLINHPSTEFFVKRSPRWHDYEIESDENGQRLNGVLNVKYTVNRRHPVWSPIDFAAYERYVNGNTSAEDINLLARQLVFLIYTVRNNTFHGGKRADDANDLKVVEMALPLLRMIVESFMSRAG